jgi:transposase
MAEKERDHAERAREMKVAGRTVSEIAKALGVTKKTAYRWVNPSHLRSRAKWIERNHPDV